MEQFQGLQIADLRSASVIDREKAENPARVRSFRASVEGEPLRVAHASNVLFDPRLRLQILPGGVVPAEGLDAWSLNFFRDGYPRNHFAGPYKPDYSDLDVCILSSETSGNFYHWTTEQMRTVLVMEELGFEGAYVVGDEPWFCFDFLETLSIPPERIVEIRDRPCVFKTAAFVSPVTAKMFPDGYEWLLFWLRERLTDLRNPDLAPTPTRIWVDRKRSVERVQPLINRDRIYELLDRYGFHIVDMAAYGVRDQITIATRAEALSGMHGAAFTHTLFMPPRSIVVECFSPEYINASYWEICRLLDHRHAMVVHPNAFHAYPAGGVLKVGELQLELALRSFDLRPDQPSQAPANRKPDADVEDDLNRLPEHVVRRLARRLRSGWIAGGGVALANIYGEGWSQREPWGRWGVGERHELKLFFTEAPAADLQLEIECHVPLMGTRTEQQVDVFVGDDFAARWTFAKGANSAIRALPIKASAVTLPELRIAFVPRSVAPLSQLGPDIMDTRELGLGIVRLRVVEAQAGKTSVHALQANGPERAG